MEQLIERIQDLWMTNTSMVIVAIIAAIGFLFMSAIGKILDKWDNAN